MRDQVTRRFGILRAATIGCRNANEALSSESGNTRHRLLLRPAVCVACLAAAVWHFVRSIPDVGRVGFPVEREYFTRLLVTESIAVTAVYGAVFLSRCLNWDAIKTALAGTLLGILPATALNLTLFQRARETGRHVFGDEDVFRIARGLLMAWAFGLAFPFFFRLMDRRSAPATSARTDRTAI